MFRKFLLSLCIVLVAAVMAMAQDQGKDKEIKKESEQMKKESEAKELSGMSIVGNDEAPKSLYIVPWKNSEIGVETSLEMMLDERDVPVDRDVFKRQLEFYKVRSAK